MEAMNAIFAKNRRQSEDIILKNHLMFCQNKNRDQPMRHAVYKKEGEHKWQHKSPEKYKKFKPNKKLFGTGMAVLNILPPESFLKVLGFSLLNIVVMLVMCLQILL